MCISRYTEYYQGKVNEGVVNSRYNEILDQTIPNSVGINLQLFCDCYSTIPVLFHEYLHYLGDHNEAAIFLATYNFWKHSLDKYPEASEILFYDYNYTYVTMKTNMSGKSKEEQIAYINKLISNLYGPKMNIDKAKLHAVGVISSVNYSIEKRNNKQTWHKEIKYPYLTIVDAPQNTNLAYNAIIRFSTVDKKIDELIYNKYLKSWEIARKGIKAKYNMHYKVYNDYTAQLQKALSFTMDNIKK